MSNGSKWSAEETISLIQFCNKNGGFIPRTSIANEWIKATGSDRSINAVDKKMRVLENEKILFSPESIKVAKRETITFDIMRDEFNDWLGRTPRVVASEPKPDTVYEKTMVLSDIHCPYTRWDELKRAVDIAHEQGIKRLWLNGDTEDWT